MAHMNNSDTAVNFNNQDAGIVMKGELRLSEQAFRDITGVLGRAIMQMKAWSDESCARMRAEVGRKACEQVIKKMANECPNRVSKEVFFAMCPEEHCCSESEAPFGGTKVPVEEPVENKPVKGDIAGFVSAATKLAADYGFSVGDLMAFVQGMTPKTKTEEKPNSESWRDELVKEYGTPYSEDLPRCDEDAEEDKKLKEDMKERLRQAYELGCDED